MSANSKIEWTDHTFNPWIGCTKVSPACDHCYAEVSTPSRALGVTWGAGQERRRTSAANWALPLRWNAQAEAFATQHGRRQRVFCASLADVFDNEVPTEWRNDLFELIAATPHLDWLLLTKRIGNVARMLPSATSGEDAHSFAELWPHVWIGATICNQPEADRDIPKLLKVPARVRFLSMEPLLGPVDLAKSKAVRSMCATCLAGQSRSCILSQPGPFVDWVIVGGESGPQARPMHPDWARGLRDQCESAGVPFLFKQWGEWGPTWFEAHRYLGLVGPADPAGPSAIAGTRFIVGQYRDGRKYEELWPVVKVGKKAAGRLLDGVQHDGVPA